MLNVNVLSSVLGLCIISECGAHFVVAVQRDCWDNVKRYLVDESAHPASFFCCVRKGNVFCFCVEVDTVRCFLLLHEMIAPYRFSPEVN